MEQNNAQGLTEEFFFGSGVMTPDRAEGLIEEYPIFAEDLAGIASDSLPAQLREMADDPEGYSCLLYTSPSPRDSGQSRMPSSA